MKPLRLAALAAALLLAGCTASPTTTATDARPSFDGGANDGGNTLGGGHATTQSDSTSQPGRGGGSLGSGN